MKLGMSMACYRWELYPDKQRDGRAYRERGYPELYFSSVPVALPIDKGGLEWLMDHCAELGLQGLYAYSPRLEEPEYAASIREKSEELGLEMILVSGFDWASEGDSAKHEIEKYVKRLRIAKDMGSQVVNVTHSEASWKNHYTREPSITRQIEHMKINFARVTDHAEKIGIVMALENHADYRCSELAQVLNYVDSPFLKANLDTGNPVNVIEDPVEAARSVASHTIMVHLKDYRVLNSHILDGAPRFTHAPTGQGDLPLGEMLDILQRHSPDPENLRLLIETVPPLEVDPGMWVRRCVDNVRDMFGEYLS